MDLVVPVLKGTKGRDLTVVLKTKKLSVGLKGKEAILDGELCQAIKLDDSTWTIRQYSCGYLALTSHSDL